MPLPTSIPFGIRDIKVTGYTTGAATTLNASSVDLPYARTLSFTESEDSEELRGDDVVVASRSSGPTLEWELESGGLSLPALIIMNGGTSTESGTTPAIVITYKKLNTDSKPYFKIEGQVISDSGGDLHLIMDKCKLSGDLEGEFSDQEFFVTKAEGAAIGSTIAANAGQLYRIVQNETVAAIP